MPLRVPRTREHLDIRSFRPQRWPAGDPETYFAVGPFGDVDESPSKSYILEHRNNPRVSRFFRLAFEKRLKEELYSLATDPGQLRNVAGQPENLGIQRQLTARLEQWMSETADPRARDQADPWDRYRYFGEPVKRFAFPVPRNHRATIPTIPQFFRLRRKCVYTPTCLPFLICP